MPKRNRQTLRERYKPGYRISVEDMYDLIDSTINILDDGFSKQPETGIALTPTGGNNSVLSIFRKTGDDLPEWQITIHHDTGDLCVRNPCPEGNIPVAVLKRDGLVELGSEMGGLTVKGKLKMPERIGTFLCGEVPADGRWHDITDPLEGCWALEVVAGCGRRDRGKYALTVATAIHCFGARRITQTSSHRGFGSRIRLKWVKKRGACRLRIKTRFRYGKEALIRYHISKLWDSPFMETKQEHVHTSERKKG